MGELIVALNPTIVNCLCLVLTALTGYFIAYINKKKKALQQEMNNEMVTKYSNMLEKTITDCVQATNQTYVEALKKKNAFTPEAQKEAFNKTLEAVMSILTDDCIKYLNTITTDVNAYIYNKIEADVNLVKKQ